MFLMWQSGLGVGQQICRLRVQILEMQVSKKPTKATLTSLTLRCTAIDLCSNADTGVPCQGINPDKSSIYWFGKNNVADCNGIYVCSQNLKLKKCHLAQDSSDLYSHHGESGFSWHDSTVVE